MMIYLSLFFLMCCGNNEITPMDTTGPLPDTVMSSIKISFLALGDSYTIGQSIPAAERWPVQLAAQVNNGDYNFEIDDPKIIATTGWTTGDLKQGIAKENPSKNYDLVSLLIGVNNQYRGYPIDEYGPDFEELLKNAINFAGNRKDHVIVVSIPDYGYTPFGERNQQKISEELDAYNAINKRITLEMGVKYYNITAISRNGLQDPSLVASDGLHPSGKQYGEWVKLILSDSDFAAVFK